MNLFKIYLDREHKRYSAVAEHLGITKNYLSYIINNRRYPSPELAKKMSEYCDFEIPWQVMIKQKRNTK